MLYEGRMFSLEREGDTLLLVFDSQGSKVNVFSRDALAEFGAEVTHVPMTPERVLAALAAAPGGGGVS